MFSIKFGAPILQKNAESYDSHFRTSTAPGFSEIPSSSGNGSYRLHPGEQSEADVKLICFDLNLIPLYIGHDLELNVPHSSQDLVE
jgi:hypothetical protein